MDFRDCECKGRNPNCLKCEGKGFYDSSQGMFTITAKSVNQVGNSRVTGEKKYKVKKLFDFSKKKPLKNKLVSKIKKENNQKPNDEKKVKASSGIKKQKKKKVVIKQTQNGETKKIVASPKVENLHKIREGLRVMAVCRILNVPKKLISEFLLSIGYASGELKPTGKIDKLIADDIQLNFSDYIKKNQESQK